MKLFLSLLCLLPFSTLSLAAEDDTNIAMYQELCAKERDPIKRQNYCFLLENSERAHTSGNRFRQDRAIV